MAPGHGFPRIQSAFSAKICGFSCTNILELTALHPASKFSSPSNEISASSQSQISPSPKGEGTVRKSSAEWNIYRTRFLIKAKQLTQPFAFVDALGREHSGQAGDYLVQSSDGSRRIAPRQIFEDIYVVMGPAAVEEWPFIGPDLGPKSHLVDNRGVNGHLRR